MNSYEKKELKHAVNTMECKRLLTARQKNYGDTLNITHHATVPIKAGDDSYGLLNVAAPRKEHFEKDELYILETAAFQIGTAMKRLEAADKEKKQQELDRKKREWMESVTAASIQRGSNVSIIQKALREVFQWEDVQIVTEHQKNFTDEVCAVPFHYGETKGLLCWPRSSKSAEEKKTLESLAPGIAMMLEDYRLQLLKEEAAKISERHRLARDLHDSVNQLLFSMSLHTAGLQAMNKDERLQEPLVEVKKLVHEALQEMKALIWQLRPEGLDKGLGHVIASYGETLGIDVKIYDKRTEEWPLPIQEAFLRIGQEALNNISKHVSVKKAEVRFSSKNTRAVIEIKDDGEGIPSRVMKDQQGFGLQTMKQRMELLDGFFAIHSEPGTGTIIYAEAPTGGKL
ncbi:histidine kinase [Alteribacillus sp. HJP-4]|uniref:GAF domain-containing sensor histidine kinase n=1 Tax=Alteribacillus sp. HJP-4 TaxID=2775394 RepID=UPI0035CCCC0A